MTTHNFISRRIRVIGSMLLLGAVFLSGCGGSSSQSAQPQIDLTKQFQDALLTATYAVPAATATPAPPTETPTPTIDPNITPPALPDIYRSQFLKPLDIPRAYVSDTCTYLRNRWDPNKSEPGTIVMPIMFHGIAAEEASKDNDISKKDFRVLMKSLKDLGFEAIGMQQFVDFMYDNAKIPSRSVLLIVDDRHHREYFDENFKTYFDEWGWPVINSWISFKDNTQDLINEQRELISAGYVDYQAHGVVHNYFQNDETFLRGELQGSIDAMKRDLNVTPIAYIWPGGGFSALSVQIAREVGYKVGFTTVPRSPVMYNWIPLADQMDPQRPGYAPEGSAGDPLMTIPRFWDSDAYYRLDEVRLTGKEAAAAAEVSKANELLYYDIICKPKLGAIPTLTPQ
ncbi:MAG: polysaccharide deacetylase family protein [Leptolinea sp.]|jgi:peptidoglycan/xylan/chitin deacetylase (PgdA/CDA1 family)|nr:polysaccharide deacetylase family protein [Leptolinea sp.]